MKQNYYLILVLSCLLVCLNFLAPQQANGQTWTPKQTQIGSGIGGYYEYLPVGYDGVKKFPVIVFIHGLGDKGNGTTDLWKVTQTGLPRVISAGWFPPVFTVGGQDYSFIVIAPQFLGWPSADDLNVVIDYVAANYKIDPDRIYLTGLSMGGGAVWDHASSSVARASRVAAIFPVCGASAPNTAGQQVMATANLPILATHNADDGVVTVAYTNGWVDGVNSFNPPTKAIKVIWPSGGHNAWGSSYDPTYKFVNNTMSGFEWLLTNKRGSATPPPPPPALTASISSNTAVTCNGLSNGSATVQASGGTSPYTYSWSTSPVQTSATASNLAAGTYTVTVKDAANVTATATVTISQPAKLALTVTPGTISVFGGSTSVSVSATGGTAPYTFSGPTANVKAGTYNYTVTDAKGCTDSKSVTITQPAAAPVALSIINPKNVTCNGAANGSLEVSVTSGVAPYTYSWNTSPVQTTAIASNLPAGTYTVTVTDANNSSATASATVTQPAKLALTVTPGSISVFGGSTSVSVSATGGTAPYTFSGPTVNVKAGTYNYTVTDANGCTDSKSVTITQPAAAAVTLSIINVKNVTCSGAANGSLEASVTSGVAPYTYSWNTSPVQTTAIASNLPAGTYTVTVTDANNSSATASATITQPLTLSLNVVAGTIVTAGGTTSVTLSATGGTAPYTFTGATSNVKAGTYNYTVTDANGCSASKSITIIDGVPPLALTAAKTDVTCNGSANGTASVTVSGGKAPYTYSWSSSPVQTTATATNLPAGSYTVTVTDANSSSATSTVTVAQPAALVISVVPGNITVAGGSTNVTVSATGGTAPYTFSGPTSNVTAGSYVYTVTDAKGCVANKSITIADGVPALGLTAVKTDVSCNGASNGSATVTVVGGKAPYTYSWNSNPVQNTATASNLAAGNYTVTVTDANNTTATNTVTIGQPAALVISVVPGTIAVNGGTTSVAVSATGGNPPYTFSGPTSSVAAGTYTYVVTDSKGCTDQKIITITQPAVVVPPLAIGSVTKADVTCNGSANGKAGVTVAGGVAPYSYSWSTSPVQTSSQATGLAAGTYTVSVTDAAGTTVNTSVTISQPAVLSLTAKAGTITVNGGTTDVTLTASGGTAPYAYTGATTGLRAGTYSFSVTDANACKASASVTITEPAKVRLTAKPGTIKCKGGSCNVALSVENGVAPYTYSGDTTNLVAGTYTYTVTDAVGATSSTTITISEPEQLTLTASASTITRIGGNTDVDLKANGGTAPFAYTGNAKAVKAGKYSYEVKDANGCTAASSVEVKEPGIKLSAFTLSTSDTGINVNWNTSYEFAIDRFEVEKAKDDKTFQVMGRNKAKAKGQSLSEYTQADNGQVSGSNTYKLYAITDFGEKVYLGEKKLYFNQKGSVLIRNMVNKIDITITSEREEKVVIMVFDALGRPVKQMVMNKANAVLRTLIPMDNLRSGIYVVKVTTASGMQSVKQIVKP